MGTKDVDAHEREELHHRTSPRYFVIAVALAKRRSAGEIVVDQLLYDYHRECLVQFSLRSYTRFEEVIPKFPSTGNV